MAYQIESENILDVNDYEDVLEYLPDNSKQYIKNNTYNIRKNIYQEIRRYCIQKDTNTFVVSLSGGVDSMVIASIIHYLGYNTICIHINYNNRLVSEKESEFILKWLKYNNITCIFKNIQELRRGFINRNDYEEQTKNIRFDLYKNTLSNYPEAKNCIMLGHHKDDVIENIFNNVCRGRNLLDLPVMAMENEINGVIISRPMINLFKQEVFDFAHEHNIPYFKNTTPYWCMRGIFRYEIFPLINKSYTNLCNNLLKIGQQSNEWNQIIEIKVIKPFLDKVEYLDNGFSFCIDGHENMPFSFWNVVLAKIYHHYKEHCPSNKSINGFIQYINKYSSKSIKEYKKYKLSNNSICTLKDNVLIVDFT